VSVRARQRLENGDANFIGMKRPPGTSVPLNADGLADGSVEVEETDWIFLGSYRAMANRGGGFIYTFLLKNAVPLKEGAGTEAFQGTGDDEAQEILYLNEDEMLREVMNGSFKEVKWAATMSLTLLHLKNGRATVSGGDVGATATGGGPVKPAAPVP